MELDLDEALGHHEPELRPGQEPRVAELAHRPHLRAAQGREEARERRRAATPTPPPWAAAAARVRRRALEGAPLLLAGHARPRREQPVDASARFPTGPACGAGRRGRTPSARPPGTPRGSPAPRRRRSASSAPGRCRSPPSRAPGAARATAPSAAYSAGILLGSSSTSSIQAFTPSAYACQRVRRSPGRLSIISLPLGLRVVVAPRDDVVLERGLAEDLAERPGRRAPERLDLEQAVLGDRVAHAPPHVVLGVPVDGSGRRTASRTMRTPALGVSSAPGWPSIEFLYWNSVNSGI